MSTTGNGQESLGDDFFEQILSVPTGYTDPSAAASNSADDIPMFLQLGSGGPSPGAGGGGGGATRERFRAHAKFVSSVWTVAKSISPAATATSSSSTTDRKYLRILSSLP
ncbi:hypothetical protein CUMW_083280 [Citrus unshiu]|nr:hypothetical protein CUMW_083280 [Citrus unshiu]